MRPFSRLDCELAPAALYTDGEPRFVAKVADMPLYSFGRLQARNIGVTARATVGLLPTLTFQLYTQVFLATKQYSEFSQVSAAAPRTAVRVADLQPAPLPPGIADPTTQQSVLNVNAVLRWEYRLGSIVYLVYTRSQTQNAAFQPGQPPRLEIGGLGGNRGATDVLMLKASFWWG
jgi:hypothetical protein